MYNRCKPLTEGKLLDDVSWIAFMHAEAVARKSKADRLVLVWVWV